MRYGFSTRFLAIICSISCWLFLGNYASAQTAYPVTAAVQSIPPHTGNLADLVQAGANKIGLTLIFNDVNEVSYQARLKVTIEGQGITLTTRPDYIPNPINLSFGTPVQLLGVDMAGYFDPLNLNFQGISREAYYDLGGLPDGVYTICIEVFDFDRADEQPASNQTCTVISAVINDPPVLLTPIGTQVSTFPQNVPVQWQAMHTGSFPTQYDLEIWKWDYATNLTPDQIILNDVPYLTVNSLMTSTYVLGASDPPLELGMRYLVRVRASDVTMNNSFRNDGRSEIQVFTYGDPCGAPDGIQVDNTTERTADLSWLPKDGYNKYVLRYRVKLPGSNWYEDELLLNNHSIEGLTPGTTYEYEIQTLCNGNVAGDFSPIAEFSTPQQQLITYQCGDSLLNTAPSNREQIDQLYPGDIITIGGFQARLVEVVPSQRGSGLWDGFAHVEVGWLGQKFFGRFRALGVNTDKEVYDGNIAIQSDGLETLAGFMHPDTVEALNKKAQGPYDFCGNLESGIKTRIEPLPGDVDPSYNTHKEGTQALFVPFDPNQPILANPDLIYDKWNPNNQIDPYDPFNYKDPGNPYTPEKPFQPHNPYNPYNHYNPYDPLNYDDPANPYTKENPYNPATIAMWNEAASFNKGLQTGAKKLPYGLTKTGSSGKSYMIAMDRMIFTPTGAVVDAFMNLEIPQKGGKSKYLSFKLYRAQFHPGGIAGDSPLRLASPVSFSISDKARVTLMAHKKTYVSWDCEGFNGVSVKGYVEFCDGVIRPVDWNTSMTMDSAYATGWFTASMPEWGEFTADLTMTPFEVPGLEEWVFYAQNVVFDFSEQFTPPTVKFPYFYNHPDVVGRMGRTNPAWTGFYIKALRIRLPRKFKKYESGRGRSTAVTEQDTRQRRTAVTEDNTVQTRERSDAIDQGDPGTRDRSNALVAPPPGDTSWIKQVMDMTTDLDQIEIGAEDIFIDETGFTAFVYASNILPIENGRIGTWAFGIDSIRLGIMNNKFAQAYLKGKVDVPAFKNTLGYQCLVQPGSRYQFGISLQDSTEMSAWRAKLELYNDSEINVWYDTNKKLWAGGVKLNGRASFDAPVGSDTTKTNKDKVQAKGIRFQNFEILSQAPYVKVGTWALGSEAKEGEQVAGFSMTINDMGVYQNQTATEVEVRFGVAVNLVKENDNGFAAEGNIGIVSYIEIDSVTTRQTWRFKMVKVNKLKLDITGTAFKLAGEINYIDRDPLYGSGFRGMIQAEFAPKISVGAVVQFGKVNGFRYWFADALAYFNPGISIGTTGMALYGFGGGAYYRMRRNEVPGRLPPPPQRAEGTMPGSVETSVDLPGKSLSGIVYVPDSTISIGIKAMVAFGAVNRDLFNGELVFEINFNNNGGVNMLGLGGMLNFLTPPQLDPTVPQEPPAVAARLNMTYDFPSKAFHAKLEMFAYVAGGVIKGAYLYPQNLAGTGVIHADPDQWYVYLGTPSKRVMMSIDIAGFKNRKTPEPTTSFASNTRERSNATTEQQRDRNDAVTVDPPEGRDRSDAVTSAPDTSSRYELGNVGVLLTAYLDFGTVLPEFPPPPDRVVAILGEGDYSVVSRDDPRLKTGGGVMFGASIDVSAPEMKFLAFYAEFYAGIGFDVLLANYGKDARCAGNENSDKPIGINGWYASGQLYAYIEGSIGLNVKVFGIRGQFPILDIGAAAILQARLPNPNWMRGTVGGYYSILGGLVSGRAKFRFEAGTKCEISGAGELAGVQIIASTSPDETSNGPIDVFTSPQASFNMAMGYEFMVPDEDGNKFYYKARMKEFSIRDSSTNERVDVDVSWNNLNDVVALTPKDILSGNTKYTMTLIVEFDKRSENGGWAPLYNRSTGKPEQQSRIFTFTTGPAPDYIPLSNVAYAYPGVDQLNFLRAESSSGFIQLKQGQPYLFESQPSFALDSGVWSQKVFFLQNDLVKHQGDITYNGTDRRVSFAIPTQAINTNTVSTIHLMNVPLSMGDIPVDQNVNTIITDYGAQLTNQQSENMEEYSTIMVKEKVLEGDLKNLEVKEFYTAHFRTSYYNSWSDKVASHDMTENWEYPILLDTTKSAGLSMDDFGVMVKGNEQFDQHEMVGYFNGKDQMPPIVQPEADLTVTGQNWFAEIQQKMYDHFPDSNIPLSYREHDSLGVPPSRAVILTRDLDPQSLTPEDVVGKTATPEIGRVTVTYQVPYRALRDYSRLKAEVGNFASQNNAVPANYTEFLGWYFKYPPYGTYRVNLKYVLPGTTAPTSSPIVDILYGTTQ